MPVSKEAGFFIFGPKKWNPLALRERGHRGEDVTLSWVDKRPSCR